MPGSVSLHLPSPRFLSISRRIDGQKNSVLYRTAAGNARLWMPHVDEITHTRPFFFSILFDAQVRRVPLDGVKAESYEYS
jgi:hypothetical protein